MFVKTICFKDVQPGDVVCQEKNGTLLEVRKAGFDPREVADHPGLYLVGVVAGTESFCMMRGQPEQFIGLVRRPWSKDIGAGSYLRIVHDLTGRFMGLGSGSERDKVLADLRQELEAYELGLSAQTGKTPERVSEPTPVSDKRDDPMVGC